MTPTTTAVTLAVPSSPASPANAAGQPTPATSPTTRAQVGPLETSTSSNTTPPAAAPAEPFTTTAVLTLILGSSVIGAVLAAILSNLRAAADRRRDRYAAAIAHLVAWHEYPYRIRRRTSNDAATLSALADRGHELQEASACHRAWIAGDSQALAQLYDAWLQDVQQRVGRAAEAAWNVGPVRKPAGMNLGSVVDGDARAASHALGTAVRYRFGVRRLLPSDVVHRRVTETRLYPGDAQEPAASREPTTTPMRSTQRRPGRA